MKCLSIDVGMKNLGLCIIDKDRIAFWKVVCLSPNHKEDICSCVVRTLDAIPECLDVDIVLIEKQPSKNNKMRIIEAFLNAYFIIRGKTNDKCPISNSIIYSAKHKLGGNTFKGKRSYKERKRLSVTRANEFVNRTKQAQWVIDVFASSNKKDDLADSLLQALSYVNNTTIDNISHEELPCSQVIHSRKPTAKQERLGYSRSNIKYFLTNSCIMTPKLESNILKYYASVESAKAELL